MGFFPFAKPAWKSRDPEVRLKALSTLVDRQSLLSDLALGDDDGRVRVAAANLLNRQDAIERLLQAPDAEVRRVAGERLSRFADRWLREKPLAECRAFLERLTDQKSMAELSVHAKDAAVRAAALAKLLAQAEPSEALLELVAVQDASGDQAKQALERIGRRSTLKNIARKAKAEAIRTAAAAKAEIIAQEEDRPSSEQVQTHRRKTLPTLLDQAMRLAVATDVEAVANGWAPIVSQWEAILADRPEVPLLEESSELDRRFRRAKAEFDQRLATERERVSRIRQTREAFLSGLNSREPVAPEQSKVERASLEQTWSTLGDLPSALRPAIDARFLRELDRLCPPYQAPAKPPEPEIPDQVREKLEAICTEAEQLIDGNRDARFRYQELHKEWSKLSEPLHPQHVLKQRFLAAFVAHKDHRRQAREQRQEHTQERVAALDRLVAEAERLAESAATIATTDTDALKAHSTALKGLQHQWKEIGFVPPGEHARRRERYQAAMDRAWAPVAEMREAETWERFTHLAHAEELIVRVEALAQETDLGQVAGAVKRAHQDWKALGSLPRDKGQEAWARFKAACDTQFERCRPYFAELDATRLRNLDEKQALLKQLDDAVAMQPPGLPGSPAWINARRDQHDQVKAMQERWKAIGPVPREHEDATWQQYRAIMDRHFAAHRDEMTQRNAEQVENANRKLALIVQCEDLAKAAEAGVANPSLARPPERTLGVIKDLQQQWKSIGHVPRDQVESTWQRWKAAQDRVYATLKDHLAEQDAEREANAAKKEALIKEAEELTDTDHPQWFKEDIRELQKKWREIGHVPRNRMDDLNDRFRTVCDKVFRE